MIKQTHFTCELKHIYFDFSTIEIQQFSYAVYYGFLKYLYTDSVESATTEETVGESVGPDKRRPETPSCYPNCVLQSCCTSRTPTARSN